MKATCTAVLCLLICLLVSTDCGSAEALSKRLHRQKRAWSYPDINVLETPPESVSRFTRTKLATIKSDNENVVKYKFDPTSAFFEMESSVVGGVIWQVLPLDREEQAIYKLWAYALDSNNNELEEPAPVKIVVLDLNDNSPVFKEESLSGNVREDVKSGSFMQVKATDSDSSLNDNNLVKYFYIGIENPPSPSGNPRFAVSKEGLVSVVGDLDAETVPKITFTVEARDSGGAEYGRRTTATVTVTINDANDHAPVYTNTQPYMTDVGELTDIQSVIMELYANDADSGINKEVSFRITNGNSAGKFSVKSYPSTTGTSRAEIVLENNLDYETETSYMLTVEAYNAGADNADNPMYKNITTVRINVNDENEPPIFKNVPYAASVTENDGDAILMTVLAEDPDLGGIQTVSYSLLNGQSWFAIDNNGLIKTINNGIDRENPVVKDSEYILTVIATDNAPIPLQSRENVVVTVIDVNDNAPEIKEQQFTICEKPTSSEVGNLTIVDKDETINGPPFFYKSLDEEKWLVEAVSNYRAILLTQIKQFNAAEQSEYPVVIEITDSQNLVGTATVTVSICSCDSSGVCHTAIPQVAAFPVPVLVAIIAAFLILLIIVLAVVAYRRRQKADLEKQALFIDDDDVRENLQAYHDEGGGEEDNDGFDISALQAPPLNKPKRVDEKPLGAEMPPKLRIPPDTDIGDYITDAKQQADNDPTAPPFDSLLVFDYEGQGSDAGSLSSLNSGTTDGSQDYNYLNNWGPRFKKLADMYGGGEDEE